MVRFVWSQLSLRPGRAVALGVAVLVTAVSFSLLTAAASTSALRTEQTVTSNFRPAYDILVRPAGSFTRLERERGLVPANYLSGIFGGISFEQLEEIKRVRGVDVAAPVANVGYVFQRVKVEVPLNDYVDQEPVQILRVRHRYEAQRDRWQYPASVDYVYVTRVNEFAPSSFGTFYGAAGEMVPGHEDPVEVCGGTRFPGAGYGFNTPADRATDPSPWWQERGASLTCYSTRSPNLRGAAAAYQGPGIGTVVDLEFPLLVGAIDPEAEEELLGLNSTIVSGRALRGDDRAQTGTVCVPYCAPELPVIVSRKTYLDVRLAVEVERLQLPAGINVPIRLARDDSRAWLNGLPGRRLGDRALDGAPTLYRRMLDARPEATTGIGRGAKLWAPQYWTTSPVRYAATGGVLQPRIVSNPISVWRTPDYDYYGGYLPAPSANRDTQFRRLRGHAPIPTAQAQGGETASFRVVGEFDPERLRGFSQLSAVPLESYYPPEVRGADARSRAALGKRPLGPSLNLGDYVAQPPFLVTTLEAMKEMVQASRYENASELAPISAVRIRVSGRIGPDAVSQARVRLVAEQIQERTGLAVDITAGSSPRQLTIALPAGKFGRPPLLVREGWVKKGVAVAIVEAVDRKSLALFGLVLGICCFFLANGALAAVRARRAEIGTLMTMGWSQRSIFSVILGELAAIGLVAGALGCALAAGVVWAFRLELPVWRTLLVLPVALLLTLVAGLLPAVLAGRATPLDAIRPAVAGSGRAHRVRRLVGLAAVNLFRVPGRSLVAGAGLFVGVGALTVLLAIQRAFEGAAVGTLLGNAIALQVQTADLAAAGLVIVLAAAAVADVLYRNLRERAAEFATLRASGWTNRQMGAVVAFEALGLGLLASLAGALTASLFALTTLSVPLQPLLVAALLAAAGGTFAALIASLAPLTQLTRLTPTTALAAE
jgi:putative ABC transport system permease protein